MDWLSDIDSSVTHLVIDKYAYTSRIFLSVKIRKCGDVPSKGKDKPEFPNMK